MCTVSWIHEPGGYHLLCNRDEKRNHPPALPPRAGERGWVRFLAPVDPRFGGSWIGVNEYGVSVCLLNGANVTHRAPALASAATRSRGLVLRDLIWALSIEECALCLNQLDLTRVAPFTALLLEPDRPVIVGEWNGEGVTVIRSADSYMPLTSSSFDAAGARTFRQHEFLAAFHSSRGVGAGAYSLCMHRHDAETVSFSHVIVTPGEIRFTYWPAPPCRFAAAEERVLRRAA